MWSFLGLYPLFPVCQTVLNFSGWYYIKMAHNTAHLNAEIILVVTVSWRGSATISWGSHNYAGRRNCIQLDPWDLCSCKYMVGAIPRSMTTICIVFMTSFYDNSTLQSPTVNPRHSLLNLEITSYGRLGLSFVTINQSLLKKFKTVWQTSSC